MRKTILPFALALIMVATSVSQSDPPDSTSNSESRKQTSRRTLIDKTCIQVCPCHPRPREMDERE